MTNSSSSPSLLNDSAKQYAGHGKYLYGNTYKSMFRGLSDFPLLKVSHKIGFLL